MVQWNGEKDAILLMGIFEVMDIKVSMHLCGELAKKVGEGCTAKAVSHRINNLKNRGKLGAAATPTGTPKKGIAGTPKNPRSTGRGKKTKVVDDEQDPVDDDEEVLQSPSRGRKRGRALKMDESDDDEVKKKVKREIVEEDEEMYVSLFGKKNGRALKEVKADESDEEVV